LRPLDRLNAIRDKDERLVLGLSSGTSADGVDAALVKIRGCAIETEIEVVAGRTYPYDRAVRERVVSLGSAGTADICRANFALGEFFAASALDLIHDTGRRRDDVDLIGSHGQTVYHVPSGPRTPPSTLQIGEPDVIAEMTRIPVVADFRTRDIAAGGDGAPLLPYVDFLLFRREGAPTAIQNIGGIANATLVNEDIEDLLAFDTGPGNMPLDHIVKVLTRGAEAYDQAGKNAMRGRVDENLLNRLLAHPYLKKEPPKTTGRETFGEAYVMRALETKGNTSVLDVLATMTLFVARSIHEAYESFVFPRGQPREVLVSGGGLRNLTLMAHLRRLFHPIPVRSIGDRGHDPDLREAIAFAVLANETIFGNPNNVPPATGAKWPVVLGKISP
jgi:anhydro-N-acetylmuramic acid kinase